MPVAHTYNSTSKIETDVNEIKSEIKCLLREVERINDKINTCKEDDKTDYKFDKKIALHRSGKMFWWTKNEKAVRYRLRLFIDDFEIDTIEVERNKAYHTFTDLSDGERYKLLFEVEDRNGEIINKMEMEF